MKYNFKLFNPKNNSTLTSDNVYPSHLLDNKEEYIPGLVYVNFDLDEFEDAKLYTDASKYIGWKWTTISYLNEHLNFNDIKYTFDNKRRDEDIRFLTISQYGDDKSYTLIDDDDRFTYLPDNNLNNLTKDITNSVTLEEFNRKYQALLFYEQLLDKSYYTKGIYALGNKEVQKYTYNDRIFINPYSVVSIQNTTDNLEAYLWIRGVPIRMKEYISSKNNDNTVNYIIEYPDYLLKDYKENYKSADYIELKKLSTNANIYYTDTYDILINSSNFINAPTTGYSNHLAPLNLLEQN